MSTFNKIIRDKKTNKHNYTTKNIFTCAFSANIILSAREINKNIFAKCPYKNKRRIKAAALDFIYLFLFFT